MSGDEISVSTTPGPRLITATYGTAPDTLSDSVSLSATAGPLAYIVVTPSALFADEGGSVTVSVEGFDAHDNTLGDLTGSATITSSQPGDSISGTTVTFLFDPAAAATTAIPHVLTATTGGLSGQRAVIVEPATRDIELTLSSTTATVGDTITVNVVALTAGGTPLGDVSSAIVVTSDQPGDIVSGNTVTFTHASPHVITATYGTLSLSATVEVSPRARLGNTGADVTRLLATGLALLLLGTLAVTVVGARLRSESGLAE